MIETLEETLDRINIPGVAVKIDRMELDIVLDEKENWLEQLAINVSEQLRKQLEERMSVSSGSETGTTRLSSHENFFEAFVYFLQQGILPWWYDSKEQRSFFEELDILLDQGFSGHMKTVMKELVTLENVQQRITWQLPERTFYQLIQAISFAEMPNLELLVTSVEKIVRALSTEEKKEVSRLLRKIILQQVGETDSGISEKVVVEKFIQAIAGKKLVTIFAEQADRISHSYLKEVLISEVINKKPSSPPEGKVKEPEDILKVPDADNKPVQEKKKGRDLIADEAAEGFYISNAGLVIAAGFLPLIFKKLSLFEEGKITEVDKAVCLVQYLASGQDHVAEFELGLAKVLCGLEMETPVDTSIELSAVEKEEATELLLSVIEYWSIIKDTSVAGLRESFLVRDGKLSFKNDQWQLQVEQKPFDMLLQSLPWNISMIKLPWMKYLLKTEWVF